VPGTEVGARKLTGGVSPREQVAELQRSRLFAAAVEVVEEFGYADATVAHIISRSHISRRTFYEMFANREECLAAVFEDILGLVREEMAAAGLTGLPWCERMRGGLWAILSFLDREPVLARVCVVHAMGGGPPVLARRQEVFAVLAAAVDEGRSQGELGAASTPLGTPSTPLGAASTPLAAEGLVGAAFAIVYARLLERRRQPLTDLLGELMGMIVLPYLGPAAAHREQIRPAPVAIQSAPRGPAGVARVPLDDLPIRLTYRTVRVLEGVAERPGASNREIADSAGISDPGQVSKLLGRLQRLGLLANSGGGRRRGEPNAWTLTLAGRRIAQRIDIALQGGGAVEGAGGGPPARRAVGGRPSRGRRVLSASRRA
jgi:AcrR family transcriptional regulator